LGLSPKLHPLRAQAGDVSKILMNQQAVVILAVDSGEKNNPRSRIFLNLVRKRQGEKFQKGKFVSKEIMRHCY
jgi:hypothetical protein